MSRIIGTINSCRILEEDDTTVTFTAGAQLDGDGANGQFGGNPCYAPKSYHGKHSMYLRMPGPPGTGAVSSQTIMDSRSYKAMAIPARERMYHRHLCNCQAAVEIPCRPRLHSNTSMLRRCLS